MIIANVRAGRSAERLCDVVRAWLAVDHQDVDAALDDSQLFGEAFRIDAAVRAAVRRPSASR